MSTSPNWLSPSLLESISDGFVFVDQDLRYVYINHAAEKLLLHSREELIGRRIWDVFQRMPNDRFAESIDEALRTGRPTHVDELNSRRGVWFDVHNYPSREGLTILFRDITEAKQQEAVIRASERRFHTLADAAPVLIWMSGTNTHRHYFNKVWLDFTGHSLEQEYGTGWTENVHPADLERYLRTCSEAFERHEAFVIEYRMHRHDGVYRWVLDRGTPLMDAGGLITGYIGSCTDIHELRTTEEQMSFLAEASTLLGTSLDYEQTLRHVADLMVPHLADWCAVDVYDDSGSLTRVAVSHVDPSKVRWAREVARRYPDEVEQPYTMAYVARTGEPVLIPVITEEMLIEAARDEEHLNLVRQVGFRSMMVVPLQAREKSLGAIMMVWAETEAHYTESDLRFARDLARRAATAIENARLYREARIAEADLRLLNETLEERVHERTLALEEEVRERTTAEADLARAVAQLQERNRDLQDFTSIVSHDLQEPLRKILAFSELIREEYSPVVSEEGRHYIDRVQDAGRRMTMLIRDLLAYSRLTAENARFEKVDLNEVLSGVVSDLEVRIRDVHGVIESDQLPTLEADSTQMRQLFQNLIGNALKFHRPGEPPKIRIVSTQPSEDMGPVPTCHLEFHDNGIGFEQKHLDEIFVPFKRLHSREEYPGTGIGLAICKRIVERHHGLISAQSRPGEGSVFTITLPVSHRIPPPESAIHATA